MKQHDLFSYVYDFLSQLMDHEEILLHVRKIVFFGSVVRGTFQERSDVDLFVDVPLAYKNSVEILVHKQVNLFEKRIEKTWMLRGVNLPLKVLIGDLDEERWSNLKDEMAHYGKVVYGVYEEKPQQLRHRLLVMYELGGLKQKQKMAFIRSLLGYTSRKGKNEYVQEGLLASFNGIKIGANTVMIDREYGKEIKELFKKYKVKYKIKDMWGI